MATWQKDARGLLTGEDWSNWLRRDDKFVDPYLVWADISGPTGFAAPGNANDKEAARRWPFIIELASKDMAAQCLAGAPQKDVPVIFGVLDIPGVYKRQGSTGTTIAGQYLTAQLLPCDVFHLMRSCEVRRAQLGLPRIRSVDNRPVARPTGLAKSTQPRVVVGVIDDGFGFAHARLLDREGLPRVRYLWDQDNRREDMADPAFDWRIPENLGYGAELVPAVLDKWAGPTQHDPADPWKAYRRLNYGRYRLDPEAHSSAPEDADGQALPIESMISDSHGHSVADLAAGYPLARFSEEGQLPASKSPSPRTAKEVRELWRKALQANEAKALKSLDAADQWHLVLVQLPVRTVADTSGGSLAVHVLDAMHYIAERARAIPYVGDDAAANGNPDYSSNPVVINISYGAMGGGHDGSSILEKAIEAFVQDEKQRRWVVLAAGNAHTASAHASVELGEDGPKAFTWLLGPDNPLESYLEIWLPDQDVAEGEVAAKTLRRIGVEVWSPDRQHLASANCDEVWQLRGTDPAGKASPPLAALIYSRRVVQSEHGTMVLLAVAPTRPNPTRSGPQTVAPHGEWTVAVNWGSDGAGRRATVHAWCERGDLLFGVSRRQQSRVFSDEPLGEWSEHAPEALSAWGHGRPSAWKLRTTPGLRPRPTLSSLASGPPARKNFAMAGTAQGDVGKGEVVVVAGHRLNDGEVSAISSGGPSRLVGIVGEWEQLAARGTTQAGSPAQGAVNAATTALARSAPDVTAPSDVSPAVPGLRAAGLHSAVEARISGTSAAAALVTRSIASVQYAYTVLVDKLKPDQWVAELECVLFDHSTEHSKPVTRQTPDSARPTLTPRADDAFRNGKSRLR
ncbi:MAG: hypothetical protein J0M00_08925 [Burkholderiales bacterium]|nr:hypothetical protein [Burkholderiales bacterium]